MNPDYFSQNYEFSTIKDNATYNGERLRIREIKRQDGEPMSRKQMIKMCNGFLADLREKYPGVDGLISVSIKCCSVRNVYTVNDLLNIRNAFTLNGCYVFFDIFFRKQLIARSRGNKQ